MNILFVCTGNTCRSPMAEALFKKMAESDNKLSQYQAGSAGIFASPGSGINNIAAKILRDIYDIDFSSFSSRTLTKEMITGSDLILTMEKTHKAYILNKWSNAAAKVFTLNEYAEDDGGQDIPDPFGGSYDTYRVCAESIIKALVKIKK